jgi:hypothetical protein
MNIYVLGFSPDSSSCSSSASSVVSSGRSYASVAATPPAPKRAASPPTTATGSARTSPGPSGRVRRRPRGPIRSPTPSESSWDSRSCTPLPASSSAPESAPVVVHGQGRTLSSDEELPSKKRKHPRRILSSNDDQDEVPM